MRRNGGGGAGSRSWRRCDERGSAEEGSRRHSCRELTCPRRAHFGTPGRVPAHCVEHRRDWEVLLKVGDVPCFLYVFSKFACLPLCVVVVCRAGWGRGGILTGVSVFVL